MTCNDGTTPTNQPQCNNGVLSSNTATCSSDATAPAPSCITPTDSSITDVYNFTQAQETLTINGFNVTGITCNSGYEEARGGISATVCDSADTAYNVTGCSDITGSAGGGDLPVEAINYTIDNGVCAPLDRTANIGAFHGTVQQAEQQCAENSRCVGFTLFSDDSILFKNSITGVTTQFGCADDDCRCHRKP